MGSLQIFPCMVVTGGNRNISINSPMRLRGNAYGSQRRFVVSCEGGGIDRRNLLMGLGGLYGVISSSGSDPKAVASPIPAPDFRKDCGVTLVSNRDGSKTEVKDIKCCPPSPVLVRKAAHTLDQRSIAQYEEAIRLMKKLDNDDPTDPRGFKQQAMIHCAYCNEAYSDNSEAGLLKNRKISVHGSWLFFPFHRWYLYFFERILGELVGDPAFALPYWNWDHRDGMTMPPMFQANKESPLYDAERNQKHIPPAIVNLFLSGDNSNIDDEQRIQNNLSIMHNEMIGGVRTAIDFMGQPYRAGDSFPTFGNGGAPEKGSHTGVHAWVGKPGNLHNEDMGSFYSAGRDPLFYSHHANVDRMWTIWMGDQLKTTSYSKNITDPDFLDSSFLFYDEKRQLRRVTVADCLDTTKLGYTYENSDITPWMNIPLKREGARANIEELSRHAEKGVSYPIKLADTRRIVVDKAVKGRADEVLEVTYSTDPTKDVSFELFVNDDNVDGETKYSKMNRAEYAGSCSLLASTVNHDDNGDKKSTHTVSLKELYDNIDIGDEDDKVVVTLHPVQNGGAITIHDVTIKRSTDN